MDQLRFCRLSTPPLLFRAHQPRTGLAYLQALHARPYAPDTLYAVAGAVKKFVLLLPSSRGALLN
jgi:hypothetical protein